MFATELNARESIQEFPAERSRAYHRFTLDGDLNLENHLAAICTAVSNEVQRVVSRERLEALFLAGGYGRGEGGVLQSVRGDQPYNDLEFYVLIRGNRFLNRQRFAPLLNALAHEMTHRAGLEVEFHILSLAQLRHSRPSMFYYDLVVGHQRLCGRESILHGCEHHHDPARLPVFEATRLLMNRGTGLLLAKDRLWTEVPTEEDRDFIARNVAKAQLALGDAVLTVCGQYHWSCRERHQRLTTLRHSVNNQPWFKAVVFHHRRGVEFKLHPIRTQASGGELKKNHETIVDLMLHTWLWVEGQRLQRAFSSGREYATSTIDKCPESNPWRNLLLNAWIFGPAVLKSTRCRRHPRERILNEVASRLWDRERAGERLSDSYQRLWERVR